MADFPNEGSFWNLLNAGTMGSKSTSNSQFPGFSSQAPMTPEQQAFIQSQQQAFLAFQQTFQNIQQNPPQQQSQSSNSIPQQTDSQPKRTRVKHAAKRSKRKEAEPTGDVTTLRWSSDEEALLAECFVAVSEDHAPEVAPVDLTEDETDDFLATVNTDELFGADPRPRPPDKQRLRKKTKSDASASTGGSHSSQFGEFVSHELRLKREAAEKAFEASKDKDETIKSLEELRFLALSTKDLSDDDAFWILREKNQIKAKLRAEMPMEPNNEDDSDE
ncbi:hypothetical protein Tco_0969281 [Tanacetum coccineum]